jgi:phospholipid-binding lipoprotein MlaA
MPAQDYPKEARARTRRAEKTSMKHQKSSAAARVARPALAVLTAALLSACAGTTPAPDEINDPFESTNRKIHAFNKEVDRNVLRPVSRGFGAVTPEPAKRVISNLADTLDLPGDILNNVLQLNVEDAATNTLRLATNLTMGVGGIFDAATALGLPTATTDFGETLFVWGVGEGPFLEVPLTGPTTLRDGFGTLVDLATNPVSNVLPTREARAANAVKLVSRVRDRDRFAATFDSLLYESADSYAQSRLLRLQSRRFQLGQSDAAASTEDPDSDFIDPYEDPYAE